jgi:hypothetical protein
MRKNKETFVVNTVDKDGQTQATEYAVIWPKPKDTREAQKVYNSTFAEVLNSGGLLRQRLSDHMREQGLWNDAKEAQQKELVNRLNELELTLKKGGIKLTEARELAIDLRRVRAELRELLARRNELDTNTAEGQAENARFNALVARCLVYNDSGEPVYRSMDEYLEKGNDEVALNGAQTLAQMMYQLDKDYEFTLPENKFLSKFKFVDEQLRLVNKDGHLVDTKGRLINEDGHFVDKDGNLVDINGNSVDEEGNYVVESSPFLDDDGNPIVDDNAKVAAKEGDDDKAAPKKDDDIEVAPAP